VVGGVGVLVGLGGVFLVVFVVVGGFFGFGFRWVGGCGFFFFLGGVGGFLCFDSFSPFFSPPILLFLLLEISPSPASFALPLLPK